MLIVEKRAHSLFAYYLHMVILLHYEFLDCETAKSLHLLCTITLKEASRVSHSNMCTYKFRAFLFTDTSMNHHCDAKNFLMAIFLYVSRYVQ